MADNAIPVPQGATLQPVAAPTAIPVPQGATLQAVTSIGANNPGILERASSGATEMADSSSSLVSGLGHIANTVVGAAKGLVGDAAGATDLLVNKPLNAILPKSVQIPSAVTAVGDTDPHGAMEKVGGLGAQIGEWAGGEEGLKWLGKFAEAPEAMHALIQKYPKAAQMIKDSFEAITEGKGAAGKIARGAVIGGAQGAAEGESRGDAVGGAEGGAVGGGLGAGVGEAIPAAKKLITELLGYGIPETEAQEMVSASARFQPALGVTHEEVLKHAAEEGIKLTPSQATAAPAARALQGLGERSLLDAKGLGKAMDEQAHTFLDSVGRFADRVDPTGKGETLEDAGKTLRSSAESGKQAKWLSTRPGYKLLDTKYADAKVDTSGIQKEWAADADELKTVLENAPDGVRSKLEAVLDRGKNLGTPEKVPVTDAASTGTSTSGASVQYDTGVKPPAPKTVIKPELTFQDAHQLRSFFFQMGQMNNPDIPKAFQAKYTKLAQDLTGAMEKTAGDGGFQHVWDAADAPWKDYVAKYGDQQSPFYRILDQKDPAKITKELLSRRSVQDVQYMNQEGMTDGLSALKNQVVHDIANQHFRIGTHGLGGYSDPYLKELFGPDATKELYLKAEIGRRFRWQVNPSGTSNVMLAAHQLEHPKSWLPLGGAGLASRPKDALSYLEKAINPAKQSIAKTAVTAAGADAAEGMENQTRENNPE